MHACPPSSEPDAGERRGPYPVIMAACAVTIGISIGVIVGRIGTYIEGVQNSIKTISDEHQDNGKISSQGKNAFKSALFDTTMWAAIVILSVAISILFLCLKPYTSIGDWVMTGAISLATIAVIEGFGASQSNTKHEVSAENEDALINSMNSLTGKGASGSTKGKSDDSYETHTLAMAIIIGIAAIIVGIAALAIKDPIAGTGATLFLALIGIIFALFAYRIEDPVADNVFAYCGLAVSIAAVFAAVINLARAPGDSTAAGASFLVSMPIATVALLFNIAFVIN